MGAPAETRAPLAFFRGMVNNAAGTYPSKVRTIVWSAFGCEHEGPNGCPVPGILVVDSLRRTPPEHPRSAYLRMLQTARFCLHLPGHQYWSPRLFEAMAAGCLPVAIVTNATASEFEGYTFPLLHGRPPVLTYSVADVPRLPELLFALPGSTLRRLSAEVADYAANLYPVDRVIDQVVEWMLGSARQMPS